MVKSPTRNEPRYGCTPTAVIVSVEQEASGIHGTLVEVSQSGMKIRLSKPLPVGALICIILPKSRVRPSVRYCKASEREFFDIGVLVLTFESSQIIEP